MIAWLGMYDRPETAGAHDRFWHSIRENLGSGPEQLSREANPWSVWQAPDLLLAQTCGYPYRHSLHGQVTLVGTPDHDVPGCAPGYYRSVLVARASDTRDLPRIAAGTIAVNDGMSQSGWAALWGYAREHDLKLGPRRDSGAHIASARMVAAEQADLAAVDAVTWRFLQRYESFTKKLREVAYTRPTPGLPYITAQFDRGPALFSAVSHAIETLSASDKAKLSIQGLIRLPATAYLAEERPPDPWADTAKMPQT